MSSTAKARLKQSYAADKVKIISSNYENFVEKLILKRKRIKTQGLKEKKLVKSMMSMMIYLGNFVILGLSFLDHYICGGAVARLVRRGSSNHEVPGSNPLPGIYVLQQGILSALLLSTQEYKWVPGRMRALLYSLIWHVCASI